MTIPAPETPFIAIELGILQGNIARAAEAARTAGIALRPHVKVTCRSVLQTPSGPSIDELVTAQQNNVKRLAAQITQAASGSRGCPPAS